MSDLPEFETQADKRIAELEQQLEEVNANNARLREAFTDISNMCIGEISMNYKLDAQCVGQIIYEATGLTNPELNNLRLEGKT